METCVTAKTIGSQLCSGAALLGVDSPALGVRTFRGGGCTILQTHQGQIQKNILHRFYIHHKNTGAENRQDQRQDQRSVPYEFIAQ